MRLQVMKKSKPSLLLGLLMFWSPTASAQDSYTVQVKTAIGMEYSLVFTPALFVSNMAGISYEYHNFSTGLGYCLALNTDPSKKNWYGNPTNFRSFSNYQGLYLSLAYTFRKQQPIAYSIYLLNQYTEGNEVHAYDHYSKWGSEQSFTQIDKNRLDLYAGLNLKFIPYKHLCIHAGVLLKYCSVVKTKTEYTWRSPYLPPVPPTEGSGTSETQETSWIDIKSFFGAVSPGFGLSYYFYSR